MDRSLGIPLSDTERLEYGNTITIDGFIVGNGLKSEILMFPNEALHPGFHIRLPNDEEIHQIIRQMDVQEIEGLQKTILRKSQRNIDTRVSWEVFRRDNFTCVYCGADDVPMTIDHIVLWELMGDSVPDNLNCSCKKCNKTRGSLDYYEWLHGDYVRSKVDHRLSNGELQTRGIKAEKLPLRKTKRSR